MEISFSNDDSDCPSVLCLGILVTGAVKVEEKVERLKSNLGPVTEKMHRVNARTKLAMEAVQDHLHQDKRTTLHNTQLRGRKILRKVIESAIHELENLNRKLETDTDIRGYAS